MNAKNEPTIQQKNEAKFAARRAKVEQTIAELRALGTPEALETVESTLKSMNDPEDVLYYWLTGK